MAVVRFLVAAAVAVAVVAAVVMVVAVASAGVADMGGLIAHSGKNSTRWRSSACGSARGCAK